MVADRGPTLASLWCMTSNNKSALVELSAEQLGKVTGGIDELASDLSLLEAAQIEAERLKSLRVASSIPSTNWNYSYPYWRP